MSSTTETADVEKQTHTRQTQVDDDSVSTPVPHDVGNASSYNDPNDPGAARVEAIRNKSAVLRSMVKLERRIDGMTNFEAAGVERVPEDKRQPPKLLNMIFFWFSVLFSPTMIQIGILGPVFGISVNVSIVLTVFATLIGCLIPAWTATLSPMTGLRQIAVSRYSLGLWGARLCAFLNVIINVGYGTIGAILGGQLIRAVSGNTVSLALGIVINVVLAWLISFLGFSIIHHYDRYAWIFAFILICVLYGQSAQYFTPTPGVSLDTGITYSGACLSYFAIIFGVCASWCPKTGDYYVHYPANVDKRLVFGLTYVGLTVPIIFVGILGNLCGGIIGVHEDLAGIYFSDGVGGLILALMSPPDAWGKFACVLFALSFLADVVCNIYSSALSMQLLGQHFVAVPRFVWCTILAIVVFALAYGGRHVLEDIITNLLSILGYWSIAFFVIMAIEHYYFRPRIGGYDLSAWQDPARLPVGIAGTATLIIGIGFSFLGMCQTWYIAPIAKQIGAFGGDVGDELVLVSSVICYPIFRSIELKYYGR